MSAELPAIAKQWLDDAAYVSFGTTGADASPHLSVLWATYAGNDVLLSTLQGRQKYRNLIADPRVSVLWFPKEHPLSYVEVRGLATVSTEGAHDLIETLAQKYVKRSYREVPGDVVRVTIRVRPEHVVLHQT